MPQRTKQPAPIRIELPPLHSGQQQVKNHQARFQVLACGRRWGKSRFCVAEALAIALAGGICWWIVPIYKTGAPAFRDLMALARQLPASMVTINKAERTLTFISGGMIEVKSADDPDSLRGEGLDLVIIDEAAFIRNLRQLWSEVVRPMLADRRGRAYFLSSAKGTKNHFYTLFLRGQDPDHRSWRSWQRPTHDNPFISDAEIAEIADDLTDREYRQEILCEFLDDDDTVFDLVAARGLATAQALEGPELGRLHYAGIDWGRRSDFTAITIIDARGVVVYQDRWRNLRFSKQIERLAEPIKKFKPYVTIAEMNGLGLPLFEQIEDLELPTELIGHHMSNKTKGQFVDLLDIAINTAAIRFLENEPDTMGAVLVGEMTTYEQSRTSTGLIKYSHAAGHHDDLLDSLLLAHAAAVGHADLQPDEDEPPPPPTTHSESYRAEDLQTELGGNGYDYSESMIDLARELGGMDY